MPTSQSFRFCLTIIDRFSRWLEAIPLSDIKAETVSRAFLFHWVSRFGAPARISCDQGRQLESHTFKNLARLLGSEIIRTTGYNPKANGMIERQHRMLKASLMCSSTDWFDSLPLVLLGLRSAIRDECPYSSAELVYGQCIRLPGQFFVPVEAQVSEPDLLRKLRVAFEEVRPKPTKWHQKQVTYIPRALSDCTHVFVRVDSVRRSLQRPYDGPFKVLKRKAKIYLLQISNQQKWVSIDRLKPAFLQESSVPSSLKGQDRPVQSESPAPASPKTYTTRRGRVVRFRLDPQL